MDDRPRKRNGPPKLPLAWRAGRTFDRKSDGFVLLLIIVFPADDHHRFLSADEHQAVSRYRVNHIASARLSSTRSFSNILSVG